MRLRGAMLCIVFGMIGTGSQSGWAVTVQDPDRPVFLGPDSRILGLRESVSLVRFDSGVDDPEPLFIVSVDGVERGFARSGDQCMDGKLGGEIVACEADVAAAKHGVLSVPVEGVTLPGCDCTGGIVTSGIPSVYLPGGSTVVYVPGSDDPGGASDIPVAPLPAAGILLLGALVCAGAFVQRARAR